MSAALIGVSWQGDEDFHVQLTESGLECEEKGFTVEDEAIVSSIKDALASGKTVFVLFEPDEYFASDTDPGLVYVKVNGLSVLGIADTEGIVGDLEADEVGIDGDLLILALDGESGTVEYGDFEGEFCADGSVEFTEIEEEDFDEDDDDEDDDFDEDDDDEDEGEDEGNEE